MPKNRLKYIKLTIIGLISASTIVFAASVIYLYGFVNYRRYYHLDFDSLTVISAAFLTCTILLGSEYIYITSKNKRVITKSIIYGGYEFILLAAYNLVANIFVLLAFDIKKEIALDNAYILQGIQILAILAYVRIFSERRKDYKKKLKLCSFRFAQPQNYALSESSDSVQVFMDLLTKKTKEESINLFDLYEIYQLWCTTNEYEALVYQEFTTRIKELEYELEEHYDGVHINDVAFSQPC